MPRRNRREPDAEQELGEVAERILGPESMRLEGYEVRNASNRLKRYRCPYCDGWIEPGSRHLVAIPAGEPDARRHYHAGCWAKQVRTSPGRGARR